MSNPFGRSVEIVVVLRCKVGDMGVYGKRCDVESGILVGLFRGELYCNCIFLASRSTGPDGRKTEPSNRTFSVFAIQRPPPVPTDDHSLQGLLMILTSPTV